MITSPSYVIYYLPLWKIFLTNLLYLFSYVGLFTLIAQWKRIRRHESHRCCTVRLLVRKLLSQRQSARLAQRLLLLRRILRHNLARTDRHRNSLHNQIFTAASVLLLPQAKQEKKDIPIVLIINKWNNKNIE